MTFLKGLKVLFSQIFWKSIIEEATVQRYVEKYGKDILLENKEGAVKALAWWDVNESKKLAK